MLSGSVIIFYLIVRFIKNKIDFKQSIISQQKAEEDKRNKERIADMKKSVGTTPCAKCGAPVSILDKKCPYCNSINEDYTSI